MAPRWWAIAAAVVAGAVLGGRAIERQRAASAVVAHRTGPSESLTLTLPDRSVVRLGPESGVAYRSGRTRDVQLNGQAFFGVASDPERPFIVHTPLGVVRVVGTRFNVTATAQALDLVVVEGRVELTANAASLELRAGQAGRVTPGSGPALRLVTDLPGETRWIGKVLIFQDTPLTQALHEIEQYYGAVIRLGDSGAAQRTVTAVFTEQSFADVVTTVCRVVDVACTVDAALAVVGQ